MSDEAVRVTTGWGAPPAKTSRTGMLEAFLAEVQMRPGEWAWRAYKSRASGGSIGTVLRAKGFETRWVPSELRLYVRWPEDVKP